MLTLKLHLIVLNSAEFADSYIVATVERPGHQGVLAASDAKHLREIKNTIDRVADV